MINKIKSEITNLEARNKSEMLNQKSETRFSTSNFMLRICFRFQ